MTWFKNLMAVAAVFTIAVIGCKAQMLVDVTFDPPSPVAPGITKFMCNFTLTPGTALAQQYWQIIGGERIFDYYPSQGPVKQIEQVLGYRTDNTTYLEIYFNTTACDVEQYLCYVLADNSDFNSDQESLEVINKIEPVLSYGEEIISNDTTMNHTSDQTLSCALTNAGPPLPGELGLNISYTSPNPVTRNHSKSSETCTWSYPTPLEFFVGVNNLSETATFQCFVYYADEDWLVSPVLTLAPNVKRTKSNDNRRRELRKMKSLE